MSSRRSRPQRSNRDRCRPAAACRQGRPVTAAVAPAPPASAPKPAPPKTDGPGYANGVPINPLD